MDEGYVTVSPVVQEALNEWLDTTAFPAPAIAVVRPLPGQ
jgi:hypothetical protein